jgi:hypothetical protein
VDEVQVAVTVAEVGQAAGLFVSRQLLIVAAEAQVVLLRREALVELRGKGAAQQ